ncbi:GNAT family N-acetyltransferase [Candidatus Formimonas warabiya]|uniref:N-acetyltransferase domain-containing protein n=1 Tax=Formimonas warabiya TaxID=1761012 RepID=A0A3G1KRH8_FORW1|nr:GNAT family N-acetyltransferase [Candidatus Formimonas warabiya]ATW25040.1 hypothetical protein DCMF_09855 [Candidatus Formimonas warabiya]
MELKYITTKEEAKDFVRFGTAVYRGNPYFRDSMSDIVKMFLDHKTAYLKNGEIHPFFILDQGRIVLRAAYVLNYKMKDILMISFFEAERGAQDAVELMMARGKILAAAKECKRMVVGLDAHLNYGVGFLASHFDVAPCFGLPYTHAYYLDYFKGWTEYRFTSFLADIEQFHLAQERGILARLGKKGYTFRRADFRNLPGEIKIYTDLNNACFQNHLWWADRTYEEDYELFYPFRWLIRGENLILAEKDGVPIGFMLWYPDFNQLIAPGREIGLATLLKSKMGFPRRMDRIKIAEIGVRPECQGTGVVIGLFDQLYRLVRGRYRYCEAGWVEENNTKSKGLGLHWEGNGCQEYKKYKAFEMPL